MAEDRLRRNLDEAFGPGPDFPDGLLLSRTMAALEAEEGPSVPRRRRRGAVRGAGFVQVSPRMSRWLAGALIALLLVAAVGALLAIQHFFNSPSPAGWTGCGGVFQCTNVTVPLDYTNAGGGSIGVSTIRKPPTDPAHRIGALVIGVGGPGFSGIDYLRKNSLVFNTLNKRFDLVAFDQRGGGRSAPVHCLTNSQIDTFTEVDPVLDDPQEKQQLIAMAVTIGQRCQATSSRLIRFMDTASAARDLEAIRKALGDSMLTYIGFGYSTLLGEMYAQLFPTRVRAMVLDGVFDPALAAGPQWLQVASGYEANLQAFLASCRSSISCSFGQSGDPAAKLMALIDQVDQTPLRVGSRSLGRSMALAGLYLGLDPTNWALLGPALSDAAVGDGKALLALADMDNGRQPDGSYSFNPDAAVAARCADQPVSRDVSDYDRLGPAMAAASSIFGPAFQYVPLVCAYWPVRSTRAIGPINAAGAPSILLVGATHDPSWPLAWAQDVSRQITGSVLLTRDGYGPFSYFRSLCIKLAVDAYLAKTTMPAEGAVCASDFPA